MNFYVYQHVRLDNGQPFYVGKGHSKRAFSTASRNKFWHSIVKSVGYRVEFIAKCLNEVEAYYLENFYIRLYGRRDSGGLLVNQTDGGDGQCGAIWTEDRRAHMSSVISGKKLKHVDQSKLIQDYQELKNLKTVSKKHGISIATAMKYIPKEIRQESRSANGRLNSIRLLGKKPWNYGSRGN